MNISEIKEIAEQRLNEAFASLGQDGLFRVEPGDVLVDETGDEFPVASVQFNVTFKFGNIERKHSILIGWNTDDGLGIEYGEDSQLQTISYGNVMTSLYMDLALDGLEDKYLL